MLEQALEYVRHGLCPIPLQPRTKIPLESGWERFSAKNVTEEMVRSWWSEYPTANVGLVTGRASGVFVLDVDGETGLESLQGRPLPVTPKSRTGTGGIHIFFVHPGQEEVKNRVGFLPGLDIRGDRGQVVAPPSVHPTGGVYEWVIPLGEEPIAEAPGWLLSYLFDAKPSKGKGGRDSGEAPAWLAALWQGAEEGTRNDTMARVAGHYVALLGESEALGVCMAINESRFNPPLPVEEIEQIVMSISRAERRKKQVENYGAGEEAERPGQPDDLDRRGVAREAASVALGVRIESAYKYLSDPPSYELVVNGARVRLRSINEVIEQRRLQSRIADEVGVMTKLVGKERWPAVAQALLDCCENKDIDEATDRGRLEGWLSGYLEARPPEAEPSIGEGRDHPFWDDGKLMVNSTDLRMWVRVEMDEPIPSAELATLLRRFGSVPVQVGRRARGGQVRNIRFWRIPDYMTKHIGVSPPKERAA